MSFLVLYIILVTATATLLGIALRTKFAEVEKLHGILDGTRADLVGHLRDADHFRMAAEHASDGILVQDMQGIILWANPAYCRIMGVRREDVLGKNPLEFAIPPDRKPSPDEIAAFRYDPKRTARKGLQLFRNVRGDGTEFWNQISVSLRQTSDRQIHAVLVCRDVTEQIEHQERLNETRSKLEYSASHDMLTGLANRAELFRFTRARLSAGNALGGAVGLLHLDIDKFKEINDTHGHSVGDRVLEHVADVVSGVVREGDLVARLGGDEFVVVCPDIDTLESLSRVGRVLLRALREPLTVGDLTLTCSCSIGAAMPEDGCLDPDELMLRSDFALYEAKRKGRNRVTVYDATLHQSHTAKLRRSADLKEAIKSRSLVHYFQPIYSPRLGRISSLETLVRWVQPDGSVVPPDAFLPLAAELGLLGELDLGSMEAALNMKTRLAEAGHTDIILGFNASEGLLTHRDFLPLLIRGVEARNIPRDEIVVEVLETNMFQETDDVIQDSDTLADLRDAGFRIYLDDFGTGYAGLGHLTELDVEGVKIDRSLVKDILTDAASAKVVSTITGLCRDLGLKVLAEGVETEDMARRLIGMGCNSLQGYWIGRPMPADDILTLLDQHTVDLEPTRLAI